MKYTRGQAPGITTAEVFSSSDESQFNPAARKATAKHTRKKLALAIEQEIFADMKGHTYRFDGKLF